VKRPPVRGPLGAENPGPVRWNSDLPGAGAIHRLARANRPVFVRFPASTLRGCHPGTRHPGIPAGVCTTASHERAPRRRAAGRWVL